MLSRYRHVLFWSKYACGPLFSSSGVSTTGPALHTTTGETLISPIYNRLSYSAGLVQLSDHGRAAYPGQTHRLTYWQEQQCVVWCDEYGVARFLLQRVMPYQIRPWLRMSLDGLIAVFWHHKHIFILSTRPALLVFSPAIFSFRDRKLLASWLWGFCQPCWLLSTLCSEGDRLGEHIWDI